MKLIIDINDNEYIGIKEYPSNITSYPVTIHLYDAVRNGIPLDDVKAEMEKHQHSREYCCEHNIDTSIDMGMVRIILDNIGKESEDT